MKKILFSFLCFLIFTSSTCKREGKNYHKAIIIHNKSNMLVIYAIPFANSNGLCKLKGDTLLPNQKEEYEPFNSFIEDSMNSSDSINIFIVDPKNFNRPNSYYSCDSVNIKNTIFKQYKVTLDYLKENNFTVTYQ